MAHVGHRPQHPLPARTVCHISQRWPGHRVCGPKRPQLQETRAAGRPKSDVPAEGHPVPTFPTPLSLRDRGVGKVGTEEREKNVGIEKKRRTKEEGEREKREREKSRKLKSKRRNRAGEVRGERRKREEAGRRRRGGAEARDRARTEGGGGSRKPGEAGDRRYRQATGTVSVPATSSSHFPHNNGNGISAVMRGQSPAAIFISLPGRSPRAKPPTPPRSAPPPRSSVTCGRREA